MGQEPLENRQRAQNAEVWGSVEGKVVVVRVGKIDVVIKLG